MSIFHLENGDKIHDINELVDKLETMPQKTFRAHVNNGRNDFSEWIRTTLNKELLAEKIYHVESQLEMKRIIKQELNREEKVQRKKEKKKKKKNKEKEKNTELKTKKQTKSKTVNASKTKTSKTKTKTKQTGKKISKKSKENIEENTNKTKNNNSSDKESQDSEVDGSGKLEHDKEIETYNYFSNKIPLIIKITKKKGDFVPTYFVNISKISKATEVILEKIRNRLIDEVNLGISEITDVKKSEFVEEKFKETISVLIQKYFPDIDDETEDFLTAYLIERSLGLGKIELIMDDQNLEEIVINSADAPVWVYHRTHGWLKTNIFLEEEDQIKHYAAMIGRKVGRSISVLEPLLDAHLKGGDRVNATLKPISTSGNTITIRKFSRDPWTITKFLKSKTMTAEAAALIWLAIQYEMSILIAGGTASGKTSTLNCFANFFPPNQRIISIEDTREIQLPSFLHWVSMNTRLPNAEGKGEVSMEDLLVNSLRMRPDRIIVGEVRRKREAETLFEAIHTGHSCYATFHANNVSETIERLTNPPIDIPRTLLPAISLVVIQFRNRRTGMRRTFQLAEILPDVTFNVLQQYNPKKDILEPRNESEMFFETLRDYTGFSEKEIIKDIKEKTEILHYLVEHDVTSVEFVGRIIAQYYTEKDELLKSIRKGKKPIVIHQKGIEKLKPRTKLRESDSEEQRKKELVSKQLEKDIVNQAKRSEMMKYFKWNKD